MDKIKTIALLKQADEAYYNEADPVMEDSEYTELKDAAKKLWPDDPYFKTVGAKAKSSAWPVRKHSIHMGSIDNIKTDSQQTFIQDVLRNTKIWWEKLGCPVLLGQDKLDGLSVNLEYVPGSEEPGSKVMSVLAGAFLRGDGIEGEDIFNNAAAMQCVAVETPVNISNIHGEIVLSKRGLEVINEQQVALGEEPYANCRNAAAGIARRLDGKYAKYLQVIPFDIIHEGKECDSFTINKFKKHFGFVSSVFIETWDELEEFYLNSIKIRDELPYDIDGVVLKVDDISLRSKDKPELPEWVRALKFPSEEKLFKADEIRWYVGKTGAVTPVLHNHAGVQFQAKVVHEVTLHNYNQFCKHKVAKGDKVSVIIAGDVIPKVEKVVVRSGQLPFEVPKTCPECGSLLKVDENFLYCMAEGCPGRVKAVINSHVKVMGIEEVGPELVEKLYTFGQQGKIKFNNFPDLYRLTVRDIMMIEGYQEKSASKVVSNIQAKKEVQISVFIASLGIPNIGVKTVEKLGNTSLDDIFKMSLDQLKSMEGIGAKTAAQIKEGMDKNYALIGELFANGVTIKRQENTAVVSSKFAGLSFCFTGEAAEVSERTRKPYAREELWDVVKQHGGEVKSGVSKKLTYLVTASEDSNSGKSKKAREVGANIITVSEFLRMAGMYD